MVNVYICVSLFSVPGPTFSGKMCKVYANEAVQMPYFSADNDKIWQVYEHFLWCLLSQ
jgi:hypothetical protein